MEETAKYFRVEPVIMDVAHDCMLDSRWKDVAAKLDDWAQKIA